MTDNPELVPLGIETTEDAFLGGQLQILQTKRGSRAGVDAVFLAAACPARAGERVLELGAGSGVVSLAIARRVDGVSAAGVEIDPGLCDLANRNAERNGLANRADFHCGDVTGPASPLMAEGLAPDSFDHAVANPPFHVAANVRLSPDAALRRAHALEDGALERWIKSMAVFVKPGGSATIIHRADALPELLRYCANRFGALTVFPLFPRRGEPASRIMLQGRKGSRAPMSLLPGLVLHEGNNTFTPSARAILRDGGRLTFSGPERTS